MHGAADRLRVPAEPRDGDAVPAVVTSTVDQEVFAALADPTRRELLESLVRGGASTATGLAGRMSVTRQAVSKHLAVLERAGLVRARRVGRESRYEPRTAGLTAAADWLTVLASEWDERLGRITALAEDPTPRRSTGPCRRRGRSR
jgi:DNA-binding transcriptional ArsR family regulator